MSKIEISDRTDLRKLEDPFVELIDVNTTTNSESAKITQAEPPNSSQEVAATISDVVVSSDTETSNQSNQSDTEPKFEELTLPESSEKVAAKTVAKTTSDLSVKSNIDAKVIGKKKSVGSNAASSAGKSDPEFVQLIDSKKSTVKLSESSKSVSKSKAVIGSLPKFVELAPSVANSESDAVIAATNTKAEAVVETSSEVNDSGGKIFIITWI